MRAKPSSSCTYFTHFNSINQKTAAPEPEARACHADNMYMLPHPQPTCYSQKVSAHHTYHTYVQHSPPGPLPQHPWTVACLIVRQVRKAFCLPACLARLPWQLPASGSRRQWNHAEGIQVYGGLKVPAGLMKILVQIKYEFLKWRFAPQMTH